MSAMKTDVMERLGSVGNQVTLTTGATSALIGWFTTEHVLSMIGVICAAISLIVTWHYKRVAASRLAAEAVRHAEIHALAVEERKVRIEECRARVRLLQAGHDPGHDPGHVVGQPDNGQIELGRIDTDLGRLEADE